MVLRATLTLGFLAALAGMALAGESAHPVSEAPLHFRLELGIEDVITIAGFLDESAGTGRGYDLVALDRDGDGACETVVRFRPDPRGRTRSCGTVIATPKFDLEHEDAKWTLHLYGLEYEHMVEHGEDGTRVPIYWIVNRDDIRITFSGGSALLHPTVEAAAKGRPIRLGPPFDLRARGTSRGMQSLVEVNLHDGNGGTLNGARAGGKERQIRVALRQGEKTMHTANVQYG